MDEVMANQRKGWYSTKAKMKRENKPELATKGLLYLVKTRWATLAAYKIKVPTKIRDKPSVL